MYKDLYYNLNAVKYFYNFNSTTIKLILIKQTKKHILTNVELSLMVM